MTAGSHHLSARCRLLITLAILALLFTVNTIQNMSSIKASPTSPTEVAIIHTNTSPAVLSDTEIAQMVRDAVAAAGGLGGIVQPGDKVLVHPNVVNTAFPSGCGAVTDRRVTEEVVRIAKELTGPTGEVVIAEGSALWGPFDPDTVHAYGPQGMTEECFHDAGYDVNKDGYDDATGVRLVDLNHAGGTYSNFPGYPGPFNTNYVTGITLQNGLLRSTYYLSNELMTADVVINVPVFKNHELAGTTGALKLAVGTAPADIYHYIENSWGAYGYMKWGLMHQGGVSSWDGTTYLEYEQNARAIVDLNRCRKPDFVVTDAIKGVVNGPVGHSMGHLDTVTMGCILAGRDPVAVDTIQSLMQGLSPQGILHLSLASQSVDRLGVPLGTIDTSQILVKGTHVAAVRKEFTQLDPTDSSWRNSPPADAVSPTVGAVYPSDNSVVSGTVNVTAAGIADNQGSAYLLRAELYVDGQLAGTDDMLDGSSYTIPWDSTTVTDGQHVLKVYVYDRCLNENVVTSGGQIVDRGITRTVTVDNSGNSVATALSQDDGSAVWLGQLVVTAQTGDGYLYAELADRSMGLKIMAAGTYNEGNLIDMSGTMAGAGVERYLNANYINVVDPSVPVPAPFAMANAALGGVSLNELTPGAPGAVGPYNFGLLVKSWGQVQSVGTDSFYMTDGGKSADGSWTQVLVKAAGLSLPNQGDFVSVTGVSVPDGSGHGLLARKQGDIAAYPH